MRGGEGPPPSDTPGRDGPHPYADEALLPICNQARELGQDQHEALVGQKPTHRSRKQQDPSCGGPPTPSAQGPRATSPLSATLEAGRGPGPIRWLHATLTLRYHRPHQLQQLSPLRAPYPTPVASRHPSPASIPQVP